MSSIGWLILYSILIVLASLAGGALPTVVRMTHTRTQLTMSFVGGLMLGVGLLHLLPHAAVELGSVDRATLGALAGMLTMFFLIRMFHFHEHGPPPIEGHAEAPEHHEPHIPAAHHHPGRPHRLSWVGVGIGMVVHSLIDGVALAAGVQPLSAPAQHAPLDADTALVGGAVFLAVFLHKPLDAMSITWVMAAGGWSRRAMRRVNFAFAWVCPLGAAIFYYNTPESDSLRATVVGGALAFSAGVFLCIALSDLLPELQFHAHDRITLSCALLAGVALAYGIGLLEPHGLHEPHEHNPHEHDLHKHDLNEHNLNEHDQHPNQRDAGDRDDPRHSENDRHKPDLGKHDRRQPQNHHQPQSHQTRRSTTAEMSRTARRTASGVLRIRAARRSSLRQTGRASDADSAAGARPSA